jgi:hypothetical protein
VAAAHYSVIFELLRIGLVEVRWKANSLLLQLIVGILEGVLGVIDSIPAEMTPLLNAVQELDQESGSCFLISLFGSENGSPSGHQISWRVLSKLG